MRHTMHGVSRSAMPGKGEDAALSCPAVPPPQWVPVNSTMLQKQPALKNVPVDPPAATRTDSWKFDSTFSGAKARSAVVGTGDPVLLHDPHSCLGLLTPFIVLAPARGTPVRGAPSSRRKLRDFIPPKPVNIS